MLSDGGNVPVAGDGERHPARTSPAGQQERMEDRPGKVFVGRAIT